jgi:hypothetical protein
MYRRHRIAWLAALFLASGWATPATAQEASLPPLIADIFQPPAEFAGQLGEFRTLLRLENGEPVRTKEDWAKRRAQIRAQWHRIMGPWPPLVERPKVEILETKQRDGMTQHRVRVQVAPDRTTVGYLLVPDGDAPPSGFPGIVVPFYDAETGAGLNDKNHLHYGYQLTKRGFVSLSIGTPGSTHYPSEQNAQLQPLSYLAYVAANCCQALAAMDNVDADRIGVVGHSYGGKWALFAAALHDGFAAAAWSDPGSVFDESRGNVNYWDRWYLGYEPGKPRPAGGVTDANGRTGAYKTLVEQGHDLHELHALIAPRPFLVSAGSEDPPKRWIALNHTIAVNRLLGHENRVAMTNRPAHSPTPQDNDRLYAFFEHFLKAIPGAGAAAESRR